MNPQDDPEARIKALEQPLADNARATELGTTPFTPAPGGAFTPAPGGAFTPAPGGTYPPPPPLPPMPPQAQGPYQQPGYGAPQPGYGAPWGQPPVKRSSAGVPWIVIGIGAVIFMAIAGGVGFYLSTKSKHQYGSFTMPSISVPSITMPSFSMPNIPSMPSGQPSQPSQSAGPPAPTTPPAGGSISVAGISENKTVVCNNSQVSISGVTNTVTITGHCASVDVSGMQNHVTLDSSDSIVASGFNNVVTYHSGNPDVDNSGGSNDVHQG